MKLGILGGGQLAQMLIRESKKIPQEIHWNVLTPSKESCTETLAPTTHLNLQDEGAWNAFFESCDRVTYEWENLPLEILKRVKDQESKLYPALSVLEVISDRARQKEFFQDLEIPVTPFYKISQSQQVQSAIEKLGTPGIFKTCRWGYDGKGQKTIQRGAQAESVWEEMGSQNLILEKWIDFDREISLVANRSSQGDYVFWPLTHNFHREGILRWSLAPASESEGNLQRKAEFYARKIGEAFGYEGTFVIEFFQKGEDLLVNEMASRVHNSGHWTLMGANVSQFENHVRVGLGLPALSAVLKGPSAMINLIGEIPSPEKTKSLLTEIPHLEMYLYGKDPRPDRKLGHLNIVEKSNESLKGVLEKIESILGLETPKQAI